MGIQFAEYTDGVYRELTGITPNIQVPQGRDAMDYLANDVLKQLPQ
jgi:hypothetical protein